MSLGTYLAIGTGAVAALAVGSLLLPRHAHVQRRAVIAAAPERIIELAASTEGYQRFNPYLSADPDLKIRPFGPKAGVGSGFRFEGKDGKGTQSVSNVSRDSVSYAIDLGSMGKPRQEIRVATVEGGAEVMWTMDMDLGLNPAARVFGLFMDGMIGKTFERGLQNLAAATAGPA